MHSFWQIMKWNIKRFFRYPEKLLEENFILKGESYNANVIAFTVRRRGKRWVLPVNIALFIFGLLFFILDDILQLYVESSIIHILFIVLSSFYFILKFDAWRINHFPCFLKLGYIILSGFVTGLFTFTYFFLVIFENMEAYSLWRGV